jgi:hypothetical protein
MSFAKECHVPVDLKADITSLTDKVLAPVKLERAVASVWVDSQPPGASVMLDGEPKGKAAQQIDNICEGRHRLEMRSSWGRYLQDLTVSAGDKLNVEGTLKPAVAVLSVTGIPKGYRGEDPRVELARRLAATKNLTFFGPLEEDVRAALNAEKQLSAGWLAFDRRGDPSGETATNITPDARRDIGSRLAQKFDAQGVAELAVDSVGDRSEILMTILASGSSVPDVLEVSADNSLSVIARLDRTPALARPSAGLTVADVLDVAGAVVVTVQAAARAGLASGDVITKVDGQPVKDASEFTAVVSKHKKDDALTVEVQSKGGAPKPATLTITMAPCLVNMNDQSLLFNNLVVQLRTNLAKSGAAPDPIARLNLAVALMRLGNFAEARAELLKVNLDPGPGVARGTVQYLLALCYEALLQPAEAAKAWQAAAAEPESLLTEDGPFSRDLLDEKGNKPKK